ncbi:MULTISPECIES: hypothetical protein [Bacillota]|uniref:hypothetical protein n=1 Tax=Bacillota TaxID=1239 RepID=UPI0011578AE2|nr:hypothetical protein [Clostridioides difficile]HBG0952212.1 hypothetical protein [Clostridioides difficile]HBG1366314.1 hypothetical protein [Clostridioides difficile]
MKHKELLSQNEANELRQLKIEEKDERNIALGNAAKARAYELMMWLYAISISLLALFDIISALAFFLLLFVFAVCQVYFIIRLWKYHKDL